MKNPSRRPPRNDYGRLARLLPLTAGPLPPSGEGLRFAHSALSRRERAGEGPVPLVYFAAGFAFRGSSAGLTYLNSTGPCP